MGHVQEEATRIPDIVAALEQEEITFREFSEVIGSFTSETLQVLACILWGDPGCETHPLRATARMLCHELASAHRVLS